MAFLLVLIALLLLLPMLWPASSQYTMAVALAAFSIFFGCRQGEIPTMVVGFAQRNALYLELCLSFERIVAAFREKPTGTLLVWPCLYLFFI
jgi:hypothetical protein